MKERFPSAPAPQHEKRSVLTRIRDRFQEKPATPQEVAQLRLNTQREVLKTQMRKAKMARPGRFSGLIGGGNGGGRTGHYRQSSKYAEHGSDLFGGNSGGGSWLLDSSKGPSFSFITGEQQGKSRGKREPSGLETFF